MSTKNRLRFGQVIGAEGRNNSREIRSRIERTRDTAAHCSMYCGISFTIPRVRAIEPIRRMRGGSQPQLMRCSDENYYIVKFQNNPQRIRVLANELLGSVLASALGLPTPPVAIVDVPLDLVRHTDHLTMELPYGRVACQPGLCFGSRYVQSSDRAPRISTVLDSLSDDQLKRLENFSDFAGMLLFDRWTLNADHRQAVFVPEHRGSPYYAYRALMIDQGLCFNGAGWNFPENPKWGLHPNPRVYEKVTGLDAFEPWFSRLQRDFNRIVLERAGREIPPEWYDSDTESLTGLLAALDERRMRISNLLCMTRKSMEYFFPAWTRFPSRTRIGCGHTALIQRRSQFRPLLRPKGVLG